MASLRRTPGGSWEARYRDPSGRQRSRSFRRKTDADRFAVAVEADKLRGERMDPRLARVTFADFAQEWFAGIDSRVDLATNTKLAYRYDLEVISRWLGHSPSVIMGRTCTRLLASTEQRAAQALEAAIRAAKERRGEGSLWHERGIPATAQPPKATRTASDQR